MITLEHGTTLRRADSIRVYGPVHDFREPGGSAFPDGFSTFVKGHQNLAFGTAEWYARCKAALFPDEGPPAIVEVEAPEEIVALAIPDGTSLSPAALIHFDPGDGLVQLKRAWPNLAIRIRTL